MISDASVQIYSDSVQELALYQEFTLSEALRYFSRIYGMTDEEIVFRTKFLVDFLDLPDPDRLISQMRSNSILNLVFIYFDF